MAEDDDDLIIFSGAGISKPLGIPDMYEFVEKFESKIEHDLPNMKALLDKLINKEKIDLEELLRRLSRLSELMVDETYLRLMNPDDHEKEILLGIQTLKEKLLDFVYEKCSIFNEEVAQRICKQLLDFKDSYLYDHLKIFTTNYDICAESGFEKQNLACTTGFKTIGMYPVWDRTAFKDPSYKIHIYKLHGSITWFKYGDQIVQLPPIDRRLPTLRGEELVVQMLYPLTGKEVFKSPFYELQYYLQKTLESCSMCIVIGYSFRDDSINSIFSNASKENKNLEVLLIDPNAEEISARLDFKVSKIPKRIEDVDFKKGDEFLTLVKARTKKLRNKTFDLRDSGEYIKGIEIGKKALDLAEKIKDVETAGDVACYLSDIMQYIEEPHKVLEYARKSIEFYEKIEQKSGKIYFNLGLCYSRVPNKEKAIENLKLAEKAYKAESRPEQLKMALDLLEKVSRMAPTN